MVSVSCEIGILCIIAGLVLGLKIKKLPAAADTTLADWWDRLDISIAECMILYFFARIFPLLMMENASLTRFMQLLLDLPVFAFLFVLEAVRHKNQPAMRVLWEIYLTSPAITCAVIFPEKQNLPVAAANAVLYIALLFFLRFQYRRTNGSMRKMYAWCTFYPSFFLLQVSAFFWLCAGNMESLMTEETADAVQKAVKGNRYVAAAAASAAVLTVLCMGIKRAAGKNIFITSSKQTEKRPGGSEKRAGEQMLPQSLTQTAAFNRIDFIAVLFLTVLGSLLIFWQIGSKEAPQTTHYMHLGEQPDNELVLDFGQTVELSKLEIYLGRIDNRKLSISAFDEFQGEWNLLYENMNAGSVFCWNELEIPMTTRYLGIVAMDDACYLNELIILDGNGEIIRPVNTSDYPLLFDEQNLYPQDKTYYYETMFDEIYHGRTAYEILHGDSIYENTHPPLGKIFMSIGIAVFGMTPYGWRFVCAVFGCMLLVLVYLFARRISGKTWIALVADALFLFDFMHYTLSRIGTIDIIIGFFLLAMFYSMYTVLARVEQNAPELELLLAQKNPDEKSKRRKKELLGQEIRRILLCGIITGLAIATKWTGFYAAAGLLVLLLLYLVHHYPSRDCWRKAGKHLWILFWTCVLAFIVIPIGIYVVSFLPFAHLEPDKNLVQIAWEQSLHMYNYHKGITESHPYMSEWYEWLWDRKPLLDAFEGLTGRDVYTISSVATFGNPLVWLTGTVALLYNICLWRVRRDRTAQYLTVAYCSMLLPWLLVHRTVFIYQYFGCVLLMPALIANALRSLEARYNESRKSIWIAAAAVTIGSMLLFVLFFTEISGLECRSDFANNVLEWLPTWIFA